MRRQPSGDMAEATEEDAYTEPPALRLSCGVGRLGDVSGGHNSKRQTLTLARRRMVQRQSEERLAAVVPDSGYNSCWTHD